MRAMIGTSGWIYKDWAERFYPPDLKNEDKLNYFAEHFPTVEINNSFYKLPTEKAFENWRRQVPPSFVFAVKLSRFLTHIKRLKPDQKTNEGVDRFCSRARCLKANLGVVLIQLPANFKASEQKIVNLVTQFKIAEKKYKMAFPLAIEFRHESWFTDKFFELLKQHNVASVINSSPRTKWPYSCRFTADFGYIRFHGSRRLYSSSYTSKELDRWVEFIKREGKSCQTIYCYFNNDKSARAIENAKYLSTLLG